jgi:hypothetical protein
MKEQIIITYGAIYLKRSIKSPALKLGNNITLKHLQQNGKIYSFTEEHI